MRIADIQQADPPGEKVSEKWARGDSFIDVDGPHKDCKGRQIIYGPGLRLRNTDKGIVTEDAILVRCSACLTSYVIATK